MPATTPPEPVSPLSSPSLGTAAWSRTSLERWRTIGDPAGDLAIAEIGDPALVNRLLGTLLRTGHIDRTHVPKVLLDVLEQSAVLPGWADPAAIAAGQELFVRHGPSLLVSLLAASLPECYIMRNGVRVLAATRRMGPRHIYRRIYETAQFLVDVLTPGGLSPGGRGVRAIQRVRLLHAGIRHLVADPGPMATDSATAGMARGLAGTGWESGGGVPINQEDQAYTLLTFSWVIIRSLGRFGVPCRDLAPGYLHCWAVIGHMLGIHDDLICHDGDRSGALFARIKAHQAGPTPEGRWLTSALQDFFCSRLESAWLGRRTAVGLMRTMLDGSTADALGIRRQTAGEHAAIGVARCLGSCLDAGLDQLGSDLRMADLVRNRIGLAVVRSLTAMPRAWERTLFNIPDHLNAAWRQGHGRKA